MSRTSFYLTMADRKRAVENCFSAPRGIIVPKTVPFDSQWGIARKLLTSARPKTPLFGLDGKTPEKNPMLRHEPLLEFMPLSGSELLAAQRKIAGPAGQGAGKWLEQHSSRLCSSEMTRKAIVQYVGTYRKCRPSTAPSSCYESRGKTLTQDGEGLRSRSFTSLEHGSSRSGQHPRSNASPKRWSRSTAAQAQRRQNTAAASFQSGRKLTSRQLFREQFCTRKYGLTIPPRELSSGWMQATGGQWRN